MNDSTSQRASIDDRLELGERGGGMFTRGMALGVTGLLACVVLALAGSGGARRFYLAYLTSYMFFLSLSLGGLFFVLLQHATRAGWSVSVRRVAESLAATMPAMAVLALPIILSVAMQRGDLYRWARPVAEIKAESSGNSVHGSESLHDKGAAEGEHEHVKLILGKRAYLNPWFFIARLIGYLVIWSAMAVWYLRCSGKQDETSDVRITRRMQAASSPLLVVYALTLTVAAFDLLMSLDMTWYSTIFGVYYFAGCAVGGFASIIVIAMALQRAGLLVDYVNREHFHDLGKFLFGFLFFWGYIAFSQYMLIWYANIPEETAWLQRRGGSSSPQDFGGWTYVALALLAGKLLIPFAGLLSRHAKRNRAALTFWAVWMLVFQWLDMYWLVMPEYSSRPVFGLVEAAALLGIGGVFLATLTSVLSARKLLPVGDPRLGESAAFQNV